MTSNDNVVCEIAEQYNNDRQNEDPMTIISIIEDQ